MFAVNQIIDNMEYQYDFDHDVLHLYFGSPTISYGDEPHPGIFIKYADSNDSITGAIILDFQKIDENIIHKFLPINIEFEKIKKEISQKQ